VPKGVPPLFRGGNHDLRATRRLLAGGTIGYQRGQSCWQGTNDMAEDLGFDRDARGTMNYAEHNRTYAGFLGLVKYGSIGVVTILVFMLLFFIASAGLFTSLIAAAVFAALAVVFLK